MDLVITAAVALAGLLVVIPLLQRKRKNYKYPKGPKAFPLVGNLLQMITTPPHLKFSQWAYVYGPMYSIKFGRKYAVLVNELSIMKELFSVYPESTARYNPDCFAVPFQGNYGLGMTSGPQWLEQRNFCVKHLRNLGLKHGSTMDAILSHEANELISSISKEAVKGPVHLSEMFQKSSFNTIWVLVTGETIPAADTSFSSILKSYMGALQYSFNTGLAFVPWLKYVAPQLSGHNALSQAGLHMNNYVRNCFERHQLSPGAIPSNLVEAFLEKLANEIDPESTFFGDDAWKHCLGSVVLLFLAGGETTASTLEWIIFYLCSHQKVQAKLQREIDQVVGTGNVNLQHKSRMPYTEAVILESLRKSSFIPFGLMHELTDDLKFKDYNLQKGTLLIANLYHVNYNKEIWGDPDKFRPERFLDADSGTKLRDYVIPFQVGRRQCLAEQLARDILFMFVVKLLQSFTFTPATHVTDIDEYINPVAGFVLAPKVLSVNIEKRTKQ